jgi:xanthine dehydrogenase accessory factor
VRDVIDDLRRWRAEGMGVGRAVVVRVLGTAPRPEGATLLVADDGRIAGNISSGCVDGAAVEEVRTARRSGLRKVVRYGISDDQAIDVGLACGGTIELLIEPEVGPELVAAVAEGSAPAAGGGIAVATVLPPAAASPVVIGADGTLTGSLGSAGLDTRLAERARTLLAEGVSRTIPIGGRDVFIEVFPVPPRLVIVGAGQVAVHLVALARELGFRTVVVDARGAYATRERFPHADEVIVGWADDVADRAGIDGDAHVVVLGHDPKLDDPAVRVALRRGARYVGAMGSRTTLAERRERLRASGITDEELARLHSPIGLDLGGRTPAEIALAIMAEVVAARHGASGTPLTPAGGPRGDRTGALDVPHGTLTPTADE